MSDSATRRALLEEIGTVTRHLDAEFAYYYRCPSCKQVFSVQQMGRLYPLAGTALEHALGSMCLHTCELEGEEGDMMEDWNGP